MTYVITIQLLKAWRETILICRQTWWIHYHFMHIFSRKSCLLSGFWLFPLLCFIPLVFLSSLCRVSFRQFFWLTTSRVSFWQCVWPDYMSCFVPTSYLTTCCVSFQHFFRLTPVVFIPTVFSAFIFIVHHSDSFLNPLLSLPSHTDHHLIDLSLVLSAPNDLHTCLYAPPSSLRVSSHTSCITSVSCQSSGFCLVR